MGTYGPVEPIQVLKSEHFSITDTFLYNNIMVVIIIIIAGMSIDYNIIKVSTISSEVSSIFMALFGQCALNSMFLDCHINRSSLLIWIIY